jgi:hypothetical protein
MLTTPVSFREAVRQLDQRRLMPTRLKSADLERINQEILRASFFSAQTALKDLLARYKHDLQTLIEPRQVRRADRVTAENPEGWVTEGATDADIRLGVKQLLDRTGYQPAEGKAGTIEDLSSDQRIDLVIRTNAEMAQNHGYWVQGQDPDLLDAFPCLELYRAEDRKEKRGWIERWRAAGGKVFPGRAPGLPLQAGFAEGRMVARKDDPVWRGISRFGNPYPPFDFNSGVDTREVGRTEAVELGVIQPGDRVPPQTLVFGENLPAA